MATPITFGVGSPIVEIVNICMARILEEQLDNSNRPDDAWSAFFQQFSSLQSIQIDVALSPGTVVADTVDIRQTCPNPDGSTFPILAVYRFTGGLDFVAQQLTDALQELGPQGEAALTFATQFGLYSGPVRLKVTTTV